MGKKHASLLIYATVCLFYGSIVGLQQPRQHDKTLLLVLVAKLFAIRSLLTLGPGKHLRGANTDEKRHRPVPTGNDDTNPRQNFVHVVGACDNGEPVTRGNLALSPTGRAQRGQIQVDQGVTSLAKEVKSKSNEVESRLIGTSGKGVGVVDGHGAKKAGKSPVEETVLEDVGNWHGVGGEFVNEESLDLAFDEMGHNHAKGQPLCCGHIAITILVDVGTGGHN